MNKSILLASVAAVAAFAAAPAMAQSIGSVGASYANSQFDAGGFEAESNGGVIDVSAAMPTFGEWTVTGAARVTYIDYDFDSETSVSGSAHLSREFAGVRAGGFVAASDAGSETLWTVGAQVQKDLDKVSLTGVLSYGQVDDLDIWTVGGDAGFYPMPNLRLTAAAAYNSLDFSGFETEVVTYGVGGEYQFRDSPISAYGAWDRATLDDADLDIDTFSIGLRFSFGGDLQARDRSGADLGRKTGGLAGAMSVITSL